jgi:PPOX class probable F420-dependent enzyme
MTTADWRRARAAAARVGHLATVTPEGRPHVVACTFALEGDRVWTAVDAKPKATRRLQRLANLRAHPRASLLVDHYEEDWTRLWWIRMDGPAHIHEDGPERERGIAALVVKYEQYAATPPPGPVIALDVERWTGWTGDPGGSVPSEA